MYVHGYYKRFPPSGIVVQYNSIMTLQAVSTGGDKDGDKEGAETTATTATTETEMTSMKQNAQHMKRQVSPLFI